MKNYQLIGRKKVVTRHSPHSYPVLHLHSLPYEILYLIFHNLPLDSLVAMAVTCRKFHNIICKNFLYNAIKFYSTSHFLKFALAHLPKKTSFSRRLGLQEPSSMINFIRSVHFVNPPTNNRKTCSTQIAGTYSVESVNDGVSQYTEFLHYFNCLLSNCYGLKEVQISEISPQFAFPPDLPSSPTFKNKFRKSTHRHIDRIVLTAQSGWTIPFKLDHVAVFTFIYDSVLLLHLKKFVINESKLFSDAFTKKVSISDLRITAGLYTPDSRYKKKFCNLFSETTSLTLQDILHDGDLTIIDFIKSNDKLSRLSIDLSSSVFYTNDQKRSTFNFARFNNFFKLVCSGTGSYATLKTLELFNFDLFYDYAHTHKSVLHDDWVAPLTSTFEYFLRYISEIENVVIIIKDTPKVMATCVKCGFKQQESKKPIPSLLSLEWQIVLAPLLENEKCSVDIYTHNGEIMYSRKPNPVFSKSSHTQPRG